MFTVKWVYSDGGIERERVFDTPTVDAAFDNRPPANVDPAPQKLGIYDIPRGRGVVVIGNAADGAESMALTFGKIYVMNDEGRTVATYKLPDWPVYSGSGEAPAAKPA